MRKLTTLAAALVLACAAFAETLPFEKTRARLLADNTNDVFVVSHRALWRKGPENSLKATGKCPAAGPDAPIRTKDIHLRDPFVVTDKAAGRYVLFSSCFAKPGERGNDGFGFLGDGMKYYESTDLENWTEAKMALTMPGWVNCNALWAPEVHCWKGKWYVFATVNYKKGKDHGSPRGTWTFVADDLRGPYVPTGKTSVTPPKWYCLDGTLWVEDGKPYMVFCHEWVQVGDGEMCLVPLSDDLSRAVGEPVVLFKASDAPNVKKTRRVTDGPNLYRDEKGVLTMIWSSILQDGAYCIFKTTSPSGRVAGPWGKHELMFAKDGGHAMTFLTFDGKRKMTFHSPNNSKSAPCFTDVR